MALYVCSNCGELTSSKFACEHCGQSGPFTSYVEPRAGSARGGAAPDRVTAGARDRLVSLEAVSDSEHRRLITGIDEFDRVAGGGLVRGSLVLLAGEPGAGKCVVGSTRILDPQTGAYRLISEIADAPGGIVALDEPTGRLVPRLVAAFHEQGPKPVLKITTRLGRELRCTGNHPLLTPDGWLPAVELAVGHRLASPRALPFFGSREMPDHEVKLVAYSLSDGHVGPEVGVTTELPEILAFIRQIGLGESRASTKRIPAPIFELPREQLKTFLRVIFSCDGSAYIDRNNAPGISYSTISRTLAEDIQHLLLRFGLVTRLRTRNQRVNSLPYVAYEIAMNGDRDVRRFLDEIGIMGREKAKNAIATRSNETGRRSTRFDTIPLPDDFWPVLRVADNRAPRQSISLKTGVSIQYGRRPGRPLTRRTMEALESAYPELDASSLSPDIYWDEVAKIEPGGVEPTYDLSVSPEANFVANDLIIHNSTLAAQVIAHLAAQDGHDAIYFSGEESAGQIKLRAKRLGLPLASIRVLSETDAQIIADTIAEEKPTFAVLDSIQTIATSAEAIPGTPAQVRNVTQLLLRTAKVTGTTLLLIGHVTKENEVAGPMTLAHLVDAVFMLEGDRNGFFRVLRANKNRFGPIEEVGLFEMREEGMVGVPAPTPLHLEGGAAFGRAICPVVEGNRPILIEVQALVSKAAFGSGRRVAVGVPDRRLAVLLAVLERYADIDLSSHDVYVQVSSGISVAEPAIDAAICAAIASTYWSSTDHPYPLDEGTALVGEVALGGELRPVRGMDARAKEAARQGFSRLVGPTGAPSITGIKYVPVANVKALLTVLDLLAPAGAKPVQGAPRRSAAFWGRSRRSGEEADEA